jgi:hypothetical protein
MPEPEIWDGDMTDPNAGGASSGGDMGMPSGGDLA